MEITRLNAGRPSKDFAWTELIRHSNLVIEDDVDANDDLLHDLHVGSPVVGCQLKVKGKPDKSNWHCKFYIGGRKRVLSKGTLYQCARMYDCALVFFDKYRPRRDQWGNRQFNFSEEDAKTEMLQEPAIAEYFKSLEKHLLGIGALISPEDKDHKRREASRVAHRAWSKKQTIAYTVKSYIDDLGLEIVRLNSELASNNAKLDVSAKRLTDLTSTIDKMKISLDEVLTVMKVKAIEL